MDADAVAERIVALAQVLLVENGKSGLRLADGSEKLTAGTWIAERKDRQKPVAHEFQDLPAVPLDRFRHGIEIAVEEFDDVVAGPQVRQLREVAQIADEDRGTHRHAAAARGRSGKDLLARMRPDIGLEKRAGEAVFQPDLADKRQGRQNVLQEGEIIGAKSARPVARKGHRVPLAERMEQGPDDVLGQSLRAQFVIERVIRTRGRRVVKASAHLFRPLVEIAQGAAQILGGVLDAIGIGIELRLRQALSPQNPCTDPLRVVNSEMKGGAGDGHARLHQPVAHLHEDVVDEAFIARLDDEPVDDPAPPRRPCSLAFAGQRRVWLRRRLNRDVRLARIRDGHFKTPGIAARAPAERP